MNRLVFVRGSLRRRLRLKKKGGDDLMERGIEVDLVTEVVVKDRPAGGLSRGRAVDEGNS